MTILLVLFGCLIISFVVFGGGQVFIPYFKILLVDLLHIEEQQWNEVLSIANATPGIFGLKLSFVSGYLISQNQWWGFFLAFVTYSAFIVIPIFFVLFLFKKYQKHKESQLMSSFSQIMKPIIAGILISIIINLSVSLLLPFVKFNELGLENYIGWKEETFFKGWRYYVLITWVLLAIPTEYFLMRKYKIKSIQMILANIIICFLLFQPWLL